jgi:hypothetical protein
MIAALLIVLIPFGLAWLAWMVFFVDNDPTEEILHAKHHQFLGPGGPDDPFADDPYDDKRASQTGRTDMASTFSTGRSGPNRPRGRMTTFAEYQKAVGVAMRERRGLRKGQAFFNVLQEMEPELADRITSSADDPFYDDGKLPEFLLRVAETLR